MAENGLNYNAGKSFDEAATWYTRLNSGVATDLDVERHMDWLFVDPRNLEAYEKVVATMAEAANFEAAARSEFAADFASAAPASTKLADFWRDLIAGLSWPQYAMAATAVAVLFFITVLPTTTLYDRPSEPHVFAANSGKVETVKLADGSHVSLFADSEISVVMTDEVRDIHLIRGRAFFDVVSNPSRPFLVNAGTRQVRVVGTRFEVMRAEGYDRVAVNRGLVSVALLPSLRLDQHVTAPILIEPGTVARYDAGAAEPVLSNMAPDSIGAWAKGVLVFKDKPLSEVLLEINKLFPSKPLRLETAVLSQKAFSGTLVVSSAEKMAQQLANFLSLDIRITESEIFFRSK